MPAVVRTIKDIVSKTSATFPLHGIILRFSGDSDIYMSTSYKRDVCHLEFAVWKRSDPYNDASGNLAGYQTILQALVKNQNGARDRLSCYFFLYCFRRNNSMLGHIGVKAVSFIIAVIYLI